MFKGNERFEWIVVWNYFIMGYIFEKVLVLDIVCRFISERNSWLLVLIWYNDDFYFEGGVR